MPDLATPWASSGPSGVIPTTGAANPNRDLFSTTANQGLYSKPNGNLDDDNFAAAFKVQPEHILPGETVRGHAQGDWKKASYMSDIFAIDATVTGASPETATHLPVWPMKARIYLPYQVSALFFEFIFFRSVWRLRHINNAQTVTDFPISTRLSLDGTVLTHSLRKHPTTVYPNVWPPAAANGNNLYSSYESYTADHWHIGHLAKNVGAGWHEAQLELFMQTTDGKASGSSPWLYKSMINLSGASEDNGGNGIEVDVHNRISFGCRGAMVYAIL